MTNRKKARPRNLELISCDRSALEHEVLRLAAFGTNAELHEAVERLMARGKLKSVPKKGAAVNDSQRTKPKHKPFAPEDSK